MTPEQQQINELKRQVAELQSFMRSLTTASAIPPNVAQTIIKTVGSLRLEELSNVSISSPSNGQVLKYNGTNWYNGVDIDT